MLRTYQNYSEIKVTSMTNKSVFKNALATQWAGRYPAVRKTDSLGYDYVHPEGGKPYFTAWKDELPSQAVEEGKALFWATYEPITEPISRFNERKRAEARNLLQQRNYTI